MSKEMETSKNFLLPEGNLVSAQRYIASCLACYELYVNKKDEEVWKAFAYKSKTKNK